MRLWDFLFYASFGFVVTSSVAIAGVLLVFCYLIVPSVAAMLYAETVGRRLLIGWTMGTVVSALGIYLSLRLDLPTGATMVCTFGLVLILMAAVEAAVRRAGTPSGRRSTRTLSRRKPQENHRLLWVLAPGRVTSSDSSSNSVRTELLFYPFGNELPRTLGAVTIPSHNRHRPHSRRSAARGSSRAARQAGRKLATSATATRTTITLA